MAAVVHDNPELMHRAHELEVGTHRGRAHVAGLSLTILVVVVASLALGLANSAW